MNLQKTPGTILLAVLVAGSALTLACSPRETGASQSDGGSASADQAPAVFAGKVAETMDSGGYTYVLLERDGEQVWAAGPETPVAVGDELQVALVMPMENFKSGTLDRTFDKLYFVNSFDEEGAAEEAAAADPHAGLPGFGDGGDPHAGVSGTASDAEIDPATIEVPAGGLRIADVWARRDELKGKEVVVRGRVVKYNGGILGRNWLHLQDGTGDPRTADHDLTVTSDASADVGDLVTVRGVVALDQDFGAGYTYKVIVEKATVEKTAAAQI